MADKKPEGVISPLAAIMADRKSERVLIPEGVIKLAAIMADRERVLMPEGVIKGLGSLMANSPPSQPYEGVLNLSLAGVPRPSISPALEQQSPVLKPLLHVSASPCPSPSVSPAPQSPYKYNEPSRHPASLIPLKSKVFVVHGRDTNMLLSVKCLLYELKLEPFVLMDRENQGQTVIEKFEKESAGVGYAIVLMTADDVGAFKDDYKASREVKRRARQNVVLEFGYFIGKLGRKNVCLVCEDNVELPSDISGIVYTPSNDDWRMKVIQELVAAKCPINLRNYFKMKRP